ncbi:hypothetical protein [Burkholderia sp. Ac-20365]|uniref:hypothetical protein n=1 Tax=Burkholderia sp. Ac-20365 TaxID=2703897 RepID=UPI00197C7E56|nr:hypothetical protein [Burkholderia sp. Ac-20365]MBN3760998.1 hypothetical protein [Burkholderia sp. Ac-20365]
MRSIYENKNLRQALHDVYVAQFNAIRQYGSCFIPSDATRMLTGLMGSRVWSWRVIGVTPAALDVFAENGFKPPRRALQRGHKHNRADTAQALFFDRDAPMQLNDFYDFFLARDETVLMKSGENRPRSKAPFPDYIPIDRKLDLFPCAPVVGWHHRTEEVNFLRNLHASWKSGALATIAGRTG